MKGRYFLEMAYNGSNYHGWQVQQNAVSVQGALENSLSKIFGEQIETTASGRTDTGVHALQQFVHVDLPVELDLGNLLYKLNAILPQDISIKNIYSVKEDAHARYSAYLRSYIYKLHTHKDPFLNGFSYFYPYPLDIEMMNNACTLVLGENDFKSFSRVKTNVNHFTCNITSISWSKNGSSYLFSISANRFLRGMVRAIVGSLLDIGKGSLTIDGFLEILESKDRRLAGRSVPACGLFLKEVKYPNDIFI